ncbi:MAG: hypothetical protein ABIN69_09220 [Aestuariivirga sp.]
MASFAHWREGPPVKGFASFGLMDGSRKSVVHAWVLALTGKGVEAKVKFISILAGQLPDACDAQHFKIRQHRFSDIAECPKSLRRLQWLPLLSLNFQAGA